MGCHFLLQCMKVKSESEVIQSCPTLSDPMDCSSLGSSVHGILQARILEQFAGIFQTQGSNPCLLRLLHWQVDSLPSKPSHNHLFYTNMQFGCLVFKILLQYSPNYLLTAAAKSFHSCPTLCDLIDGSPPGPAVPGILKARTLEWVAISSSNA